MKTQLDDETQQWLIEQTKEAGYDSVYVFDADLPDWVTHEGYTEVNSVYLLFVGKGNHGWLTISDISVYLEDRFIDSDAFFFTQVGATKKTEMYKQFLDYPEEDYLHLEVSP